MVNTIASVIGHKGQEIFSVPSTASVYEAIECMAGKGVGALLVIDGGRLVGVVSERDYARKVILKGRSSRDTPVAEIMSSPVISVTMRHTVEECMALMTERRIRHLPVVEAGEVVGIVTIGDVVKFEADRQRAELRYLNEYITAH